MFFLYKNVFMLDIIMQLEISVKLTPKVTTIICHHMKKNIIKNKENTKIWEDYVKTHMLTKTIHR